MATLLGLYPSHITWKIDLKDITGVKQVWGEKRASRVDKAAIKAGNSAAGYHFLREDVTPVYLKQFVPVYQKHIGIKERGTVFDVAAAIQVGMAQGKIYEAISLRVGEVLVGGLLYSVNTDTVSVAYRVFPFALEVKLPISCSYIAEKQLLERALALGKSTVIHGRDRNGYGIYATIGLVEYKLAVGCAPYVSVSSRTQFTPVENIRCEQDALFLLGDTRGQRITAGKLFIADAVEPGREKYAALLRNPNLHIEVVTASY